MVVIDHIYCPSFGRKYSSSFVFDDSVIQRSMSLYTCVRSGFFFLFCCFRVYVFKLSFRLSLNQMF